MPRVLVVDDEKQFRAALGRTLASRGYQVSTAGDGLAALQVALEQDFDLILLDIMLPGISGYRVMQRLRAAGVDTPVLVISGKDGEVDQADAFDLGADGYLVKPFSATVLMARVRAMLRRRDPTWREPTRGVQLGELVVDPARKRVTWSGLPIDLSPREFRLLHILAKRSETVLSKDELLRLVWGSGHAVKHNTVEVYIGYLRRKLATVGAANLLCTVSGSGYQIRIPR
ncbi:MAG TPA: response regulator transcription factor [Pseudonocardia sp.]|jgi:DNA-binding response OmpR family regulator|nr:response regulator transcription factor [Pseudonocardia sp.]